MNEMGPGAEFLHQNSNPRVDSNMYLLRGTVGRPVEKLVADHQLNVGRMTAFEIVDQKITEQGKIPDRTSYFFLPQAAKPGSTEIPREGTVVAVKSINGQIERIDIQSASLKADADREKTKGELRENPLQMTGPRVVIEAVKTGRGEHVLIGVGDSKLRRPSDRTSKGERISHPGKDPIEDEVIDRLRDAGLDLTPLLQNQEKPDLQKSLPALLVQVQNLPSERRQHIEQLSRNFEELNQNQDARDFLQTVIGSSPEPYDRRTTDIRGDAVNKVFEGAVAVKRIQQGGKRLYEIRTTEPPKSENQEFKPVYFDPETKTFEFVRTGEKGNPNVIEVVDLGGKTLGERSFTVGTHGEEIVDPGPLQRAPISGRMQLPVYEVDTPVTVEGLGLETPPTGFHTDSHGNYSRRIENPETSITNIGIRKNETDTTTSHEVVFGLKDGRALAVTDSVKNIADGKKDFLTQVTLTQADGTSAVLVSYERPEDGNATVRTAPTVGEDSDLRNLSSRQYIEPLLHPEDPKYQDEINKLVDAIPTVVLGQEKSAQMARLLNQKPDDEGLVPSVRSDRFARLFAGAIAPVPLENLQKIELQNTVPDGVLLRNSQESKLVVSFGGLNGTIVTIRPKAPSEITYTIYAGKGIFDANIQPVTEAEVSDQIRSFMNSPAV